MTTTTEHEHWMRIALQEAELAAAEGEVPVGAALVCGGQLIARAHNRTRALQDPTAHAEILALRAAAAQLGNHRLGNHFGECTLYVTLEPCAMCSGAVFQARLARVVFGAAEPKTGAAGSVVDLFAQPQLNHHTHIVRGVLAEESAALLAGFFQTRRTQQAQARQTSGARLREDALRTPPACFTAVENSNVQSHYTTIDGWRMHHLQTAPPAAGAPVFVLLHPLWHWSAWWGEALAALARQGCAALAPDLIGWGRSDKPKKTEWHTSANHIQVLSDWLDNQLENRQGNRPSDRQQHTLPAPGPLVLVAETSALPLAQQLAAQAPRRFSALVHLHAESNQQANPHTNPQTPPWPAEAAQAHNKRWSVQQHWQRWLADTCAEDENAMAQNHLALACAPYPDAGHSRAWFARAWFARAWFAPALSGACCAMAAASDSPPTHHLAWKIAPPAPLGRDDARALTQALIQTLQNGNTHPCINA